MDNKIRYLFMDIDGTLTDGKIYMGNEGETLKAFNIKDGCGIVNILPKLQIKPVVITARKSAIVENRCHELQIQDVYQGVKNKLGTLQDIISKENCNLCNVAYVGDDLADLECMEAVKKNGGLIMCPADAIPEIRSISDFISNYNAGEGAIRDIIHYLGNLKREKNTVSLNKKIQQVISRLKTQSYDNCSSEPVYLDEDIYYSVQNYNTKPEQDCILESHRNHVDVYLMLSGNEKICLYSPEMLISAGSYNPEKDVELWQDGKVISYTMISPGDVFVVYNGVPHKGAISIENNVPVRKVVCKIRVH